MSILFGGDFFVDDESRPCIEHARLLDAIETANHFICNLEGPIKNEHLNGIKKVGPIKYQSKDTTAVLKKFGIKCVCVANNHIMDGGAPGARETIRILEQDGLSYLGFDDPATDREEKLVRFTIDGRAVSIVNVAEQEFNGVSDFGCGAFTIDSIDLWGLVTQETGQGRDVIVVIHGGTEHVHLPPPWLRKLCRWLIDIGASGIVTHHPHVPGYVEIYKNRPIAWSLGNFWFSNYYHGKFENKVGYVFELSFSESGIGWKVYPYYSDYDFGKIREMNEAESKRWNDLVCEITKTLKDEELYDAWWNDFIWKKSKEYIGRYSLAHKFTMPRILYRTVFKLFKPKVEGSPATLRQLNGLRCRSHREIWIRVLKDLAQR